MMPESAAPTTAPRTPPVALPTMDAQPISKKHVEISGMTTVGKMPSEPVIRIVTIEVTMATRKPISSAFGAYGKITGTSSAGMESGTTFSAMPLNAGTISAMSMRTP